MKSSVQPTSIEYIAALRAEMKLLEEHMRKHMVMRPDPDRCCWPQCLDNKSKRYGIPLCDEHSKMITSRLNEMNDRRHSCIIPGEVKALTDLVARKDAEIARLREPVKRKAPPTDGTIYFLQIAGHIKIGWTSDMTHRMRKYPPNTLLLATHPGTLKDEKRLHKMFAVHCGYGREWYPLVPVILDHIKRVVAQYGQPEEITFGAKPTEVRQSRPRQYIGGDRIGNGSSPRTVRG